MESPLPARAAVTMHSFTWRILLVCTACAATVAARGPQPPSPRRDALSGRVAGLRVSLTLRGGSGGVNASEIMGSRVPASDGAGGKKRARAAELDAVSSEEGDEQQLAAGVASYVLDKQRRRAAAVAQGGTGNTSASGGIGGEGVKVGVARDGGGNTTGMAGRSGGDGGAVLWHYFF